MITSLLSFLGGSVFRMIWGEISSAWTKGQDHAHEMELMREHGRQAAAQHERNQEAIRTQHVMGIEVITVQAEARTDEIVTEAWSDLVKSTTVAPKRVGIKWVDAWIGVVTALNASIRPGVAVWAIVMITFSEFAVIVMSENAASICFAVLGIYLADRTLHKRGK